MGERFKSRNLVWNGGRGGGGGERERERERGLNYFLEQHSNM